MDKLPTKLGKEPLIDVVFELRFESNLPASTILPAVIFGNLAATSIESLPANAIPEVARNADPNMRYIPLIRIKWDRFYVLVGDRSLIVACEIPYPGWDIYKEAIISVLNIVHNSDVISSIQRFSMKYVDLIEINNLEDQVKALDISFSLGKHVLSGNVFQGRIEIEEDGYLKMLNVALGATATTPNMPTKVGLALDIDIAVKVENESFQKFIDGISEKLDDIHEINKKTFFQCLRQETINSLDPTYE